MLVQADKQGIAGCGFHGGIERLGGGVFKVFRRKQEPHEGSDSLRVVLRERRLRGGGDDEFVAEVADLGVAQDVDGAVFADFGFAGDEQRAVIDVGRGGVAGQEDRGGHGRR